MNTVHEPSPADLLPLLDLRGERFLVTGGGGDIGGAVVRMLAHAGAEVISIDLPGRDAPGNAKNLCCDLADRAAIQALDQELPDAVHGFVHCAGTTQDGVLWKLSESDWDSVRAVNLDSAFHLLKLVIPRLRQAGGGSIVLVSSINGERGKFGQSNYAASKAGLLGLMRSVAREVGAFGIRCNAVAPGWIETAMTARARPALREQALAETALGRLGTPDDVARAVLFLCSELSSHVAGQVLRVDGGQLTA
jgi:acetoacetyl-CoA reductase/3-oxoacyl-[acyl-carrier protein] reductase